MKKLISICLIFSLNTNVYSSELSDAFASGMIQGFTDMGEMIYSTVSNPISSIEKLNCSKEYGSFYKEANRVYWDYKRENDEIKKILRLKHINYRTVLKYRVKKYNPNYRKTKKESCSKSYFNMRIHQEKLVFKAKEENRVLKELVKANYINLENELKNTYDKVDITFTHSLDKDEEDREKAKFDLKKQLQMSIQ